MNELSSRRRFESGTATATPILHPCCGEAKIQALTILVAEAARITGFSQNAI